MAAMAAGAAPTATQYVPTVCPGHNRPVVDLQFTQCPDGLFLVTACLDRKPMLRNGVTGDWIGTFDGHKGAVWSTVLNHGATRAATGSGDFSAKIWDAITGEDLRTLKHRHIVKSVDFTKDSRRLVTGARDKLLRVFDIEADDAPALEVAHPAGVNKVMSLGDGNLVLTGCDDGGLRIWDTRSSELTQHVSLGNSGVADMELSADGNVLAVAAGSAVHFFDTSKEGQANLVKKHTTKLPVEAVSLHPDMSRFLTGGTDLWIYSWNYDTLEQIDCKKGHHGPVHCLRYSPSGNSFSSGADDATLRLWKPYEEEEKEGGGGGGGGEK